MPGNKKIRVVGIILLLCCAALAVAEATIPAKVSVAFDCTDNVCRYKVFNIKVPIDYQITDAALKAEITAQCGYLYADLHDWSIHWKNRNECEVRVKATYRF